MSGDLSQSIGAPVRRGDVLFEISPLNDYRVELQVPESQIGDVARGAHGQLLLSALPAEAMTFTVTRVTPVAEARDGTMTYRVDAALDHMGPGLRPGSGPGLRRACRSGPSPGACRFGPSPGDGRDRAYRCRQRPARLDLAAAAAALAAHRDLGLAVVTTDSFTTSWYRVAELRPRLRAQAQVHRHAYRGQVWYVLQDHQTGRLFRVSPAANLMLCLMDGRRTMAEIFDKVAARLGAEHPVRGDAVRLLVQLHQSDLLHAALPPDMAELDRRAEQATMRQMLSRFANPLALRLPTFDPARFLDLTLWLVRPIFSPLGFAVWLALVTTGIVLGVLNWPELSANVSDRVFATYNVLMLALLYPLSKALHELGHAYATRIGGGEVHEIGIMLLVFFPVPYVDASASSAFPERWRRMLVGSAGIMTELALAALAMIAWVELVPGLARAACFNLILLCSVSTVLFNANPLLRFDGYYVLGDLLAVANLDQRSRQYLLFLIQRHAFGMTGLRDIVVAPGEAKWLAGYGIVALLYRVGIMLAISFLVAQRYFGLGLVIAVWAMLQMLVLPIARGLRFVATGRAVGRHRRRAFAWVGAVAACVLALLFVVKLPYAVVADGVVWVPEKSMLRAGADGFVEQFLAQPGQTVSVSQPVIVLHDAVANAQVDIYRAQAELMQDRFNAVNLVDLTQARLIQEQLARSRAQLADAERRDRNLLTVAHAAGHFIVPDAYSLKGRFVHQGTLLGYVIGDSDVTIRAVVPQTELDLVREHTRSVSLRFTEAVDREVPAHIVREVPSALDAPPAPALAEGGGGPILLDPTSPHHDRPLGRWYEIEVRANNATPVQRIGGHVFVRFDLGAEPIAWRILRSLRQSLLKAMHV